MKGSASWRAGIQLGLGGAFADLAGMPLPAGTASIDYLSPE